MKYLFFLCALLLSSTGYATQLQDTASQSQHNSSSFYLHWRERENLNSKYELCASLYNYPLYTMFTYDAKSLRDQVASTSILTNHQVNLYDAGLVNEYLSSFEVRNQSDKVEKQENIHGSQSGLNPMEIPELVTFNALVKEKSPINNLDMELVNKSDPIDIYASKYYPQRIKYTVDGHILHLEARIKLPVLAEHLHELLQLIVFVDSSPIVINQNTWASELKQTTINGAGLGINWIYIDNFALQVYFANELEDQVLAISPVSTNLFWAQAVKYF